LEEQVGADRVVLLASGRSTDGAQLKIRTEYVRIDFLCGNPKKRS
jgi:hypothetical protein